MEGELGAGKTRFVRGVCEGMGLDPAQVSSPTFVFVNEYAERSAGTTGEVVPLRHVDAYRLQGAGGAETLESIGWDRVADGSAVVIVEWASRLGAGLAGEPSVARMRIESGDGPGADGLGGFARLEAEAEGRGERRLTLAVPDVWASRREWDGFAAAWGATAATARRDPTGPGGAPCRSRRCG